MMDTSRGYNLVTTLTGDYYLQDGKRFRTNGEPMDEPEKGLRDLHWTELRSMVVERGGEWSGKAAALEFLGEGQ